MNSSRNPVRVIGLLEHVEQVDGAPTVGHRVLEVAQVARLEQLAQRGDPDPRRTAAGGDLHPAGGPRAQSGVQGVVGADHPVLEVGDEPGGVHGLAKRLVVRLPVGHEVGRQVPVRIAPCVGAHDPHLPPAQPVAQGPQHAQLVGDPLDPPILDDRIGPLRGHYPGQGDLVGVGEEPDFAVHVAVAAQQVQGVDDRAVGGVARAELQGVQQQRQHPAVVRRVGQPQPVAHPLAVLRVVGLRLADQVLQRRLTDHRVERVAHRVVRVVQGRPGHPEQDPLLAADPLEVSDQLGVHLALRGVGQLLDHPDQQRHQRVGDLTEPRRTQHRQQRQPHRTGPVSQVGGVLAGGPLPPHCQHRRGRFGQQVCRQAQLPHPGQAPGLGHQTVQADPSRIRPNLGQNAVVAANQSLEPVDHLRGQLGTDRRSERLGSPSPRGCDHSVQPSRRFQAVRPAPIQQGIGQPGLGQFTGCHMLGQPAGQPDLVSTGGHPQPQLRTDLRPVVLDRPPRPVIVGHQRRLQIQLPGHVGHRRDREIAHPVRESALQLIELQHQREAQSSGPRLLAQRLPVSLDQGPPGHHILGIPHPATHRGTPPRASAWKVPRALGGGTRSLPGRPRATSPALGGGVQGMTAEYLRQVGTSSPAPPAAPRPRLIRLRVRGCAPRACPAAGSTRTRRPGGGVPQPRPSQMAVKWAQMGRAPHPQSDTPDTDVVQYPGKGQHAPNDLSLGCGHSNHGRRVRLHL